MNTSTFRSILFFPFSILALAASASIAFSQGSLTPPGPPAPTMRTLQQAEPRIPIESLPLTITQSGSYYFTKNLQFTAASGDAITVSASDVTIDLMGFTLSSIPEVTGNGITVNSGVRCTVKNGTILGTTSVVITGTNPQTWNIIPSGFNRGVLTTGFSNQRFVDLTVSKCRTTGLSGSDNSVAVRCLAFQNGGIGMSVDTVNDCTSAENGSHGIAGDVITASRSRRNQGNGISARIISGCWSQFNGGIGIAFATDVNHCAATNNGGIGISAITVNDCTATENTTHGIEVTGLAKGNQASLNGNGGSGAGIYFTGNGVRIEGNNCYDNDWGIQGPTGTNCFIVRNSCRSNGAAPANGGATGDYDFPTSNTFGPIITVSGDMSANAATSHPWANFRY